MSGWSEAARLAAAEARKGRKSASGGGGNRSLFSTPKVKTHSAFDHETGVRYPQIHPAHFKAITSSKSQRADLAASAQHMADHNLGYEHEPGTEPHLREQRKVALSMVRAHKAGRLSDHLANHPSYAAMPSDAMDRSIMHAAKREGQS